MSSNKLVDNSKKVFSLQEKSLPARSGVLLLSFYF